MIINDAVIGDGTITNAKIKDASITSAKIANSIQSDNYVQGRTGWVLHKNGQFEINGIFEGQSKVLINNEGVKVFDERGLLRVKLGKLR